MFEIGKLPSLDLGYQGENKVRTIDIDMTAWLEEYPGSKVALMVKRPDEDVYYPAGKMEGNVLLWVIDRADRQYAGRGEAQVILKGADDIELRTRVVKTKISPSLSGTEVEAPPPYATWVGDVLDAAAQAEAAVEKMPSIGENGNWYAWDAAAGAYVDTGKPSKGKDGEDGEDGYTPQKGKDYFDGEPGYTPQKGKDYFDGEDGISPVVEVTPITGGHRVTITDATGTKTFDVMDGENGQGASITVDSELSTTSTNPIQNQAVAQRFTQLEDAFSESIENITESIPSDKHINELIDAYLSEALGGDY